MTIQIEERFQFHSLEELRDFLNGFKTTDLSTVLPHSGGHIDLAWIKETLTDGSTVTNVVITGGEL